MRVSMSELRHRISILRPVTDTDDEGNILSSSVQEVGKAWALVLPFAAKISDGYAEKVQEVDYVCCTIFVSPSSFIVFLYCNLSRQSCAT